jgi:hypothetical protein
MQKDNSFRKAFYHLKMANEYFRDAQREHPNKVSGAVGKKYGDRTEWMMKDFKSNPLLPGFAIEQWSKEMDSDIMFHESISSKALNLTEKQKEILETIIDQVIAGEEITVKIQ